MGTLFTVSPDVNAFGQLIGDKCKEARISTPGASALYLLFTPALTNGQVLPLDFRTTVWQRYVAYGLDSSFNALDGRDQESKVHAATFEVLRCIAPSFVGAIDHIETQYKQDGDSLRARCIDKTVRGHRIVVSFEVRPMHKASHLWPEVTRIQDDRRAEKQITALRTWDDARFVAGRVTVSAEEITIHPRTSHAANFYTQKYSTPFRVRLQDLAFVERIQDT